MSLEQKEPDVLQEVGNGQFMQGFRGQWKGPELYVYRENLLINVAPPWVARSQFPDQGLNLCPKERKRAVLTTGLSEKFGPWVLYEG